MKINLLALTLDCQPVAKVTKTNRRMAGGEIFPLPFFVTVWIRTFEKKVQQPFERSEKE
jgi:hypothetical protein